MTKIKEITLSEKQQRTIRDWCFNTDHAKAILETCDDVFPCEDGDFVAWRKAIESHIVGLDDEIAAHRME